MEGSHGWAKAIGLAMVGVFGVLFRESQVQVFRSFWCPSSKDDRVFPASGKQVFMDQVDLSACCRGALGRVNQIYMRAADPPPGRCLWSAPESGSLGRPVEWEQRVL